MNKQVAELLIENNCFEEVMTATRGPDDGNKDLKHATASVIRWSIGFHYGIINAPQADTFAYTELDLDDTHYRRHAYAAFKALKNIGWEVSRIPLTAYVDPIAAAETADQVLRHAYQYFVATTNVTWRAWEVLSKLIEDVEARSSTDPTFALEL